MLTCAVSGHGLTATVVDFNGIPNVVLRGDYSPFTDGGGAICTERPRRTSTCVERLGEGRTSSRVSHVRGRRFESPDVHPNKITAVGSSPRLCNLAKTACAVFTPLVRSRRLPRGSRGLHHRHVQAIRSRPWPMALLAPAPSLCACASRHRQLPTACQYHTRNTWPRTTAEALADRAINQNVTHGDERPR